MKSQRSIKNIFLQPREQLHYAAIFFGAMAGVMAITVIFAFWSMAMTLRTLTQLYELPPELLTSMTRALTSASFFIGALGVASAVAALLVGVTLSHRIFGPVVPIRRLISSLKSGDYSARGSLRKKDEFQVLMADLNELAQSLEDRHGKTASTPR